MVRRTKWSKTRSVRRESFILESPRTDLYDKDEQKLKNGAVACWPCKLSRWRPSRFLHVYRYLTYFNVFAFSVTPSSVPRLHPAEQHSEGGDCKIRNWTLFLVEVDSLQCEAVHFVMVCCFSISCFILTVMSPLVFLVIYFLFLLFFLSHQYHLCLFIGCALDCSHLPSPVLLYK